VPAIQFLCETTGIGLPEISVIAVDVGPGLFTGLRVGIATAKSMASALRVPMIGLSSLDLLAHRVRHSHRLIVPVVDGKRGEVFSATYRHVQGGIQRLTEPRVGTAEDLGNELRATREEALLVGDGALRYADALASDGGQFELGTVGTQWPSAGHLVELAQPRAVREEFVQPWELEPLYLRKSDAEINWDARSA
jgi:tRNA threonylcarbamoyladenosine biosynthesis protein TsaB